MNRTFIYFIILMSLTSCTKEHPQKSPPPVPPDPVMKYIDLHNAPVKYESIAFIDLDGNGSTDLYFGTTLIGDPILKQDRLAFEVMSTQYVNLQVIDYSEVGKRMNKGEVIGRIPADGFLWYDITHIVLLEKVTPETGTPYWQGQFKDASHHYLPVQIMKNGQAFHGWVELSMDTNNERLILHKAAISTEADKEVKAGY